MGIANTLVTYDEVIGEAIEVDFCSSACLQARTGGNVDLDECQWGPDVRTDGIATVGGEMSTAAL